MHNKEILHTLNECQFLSSISCWRTTYSPLTSPKKAFENAVSERNLKVWSHPTLFDHKALWSMEHKFFSSYPWSKVDQKFSMDWILLAPTETSLVWMSLLFPSFPIEQLLGSVESFSIIHNTKVTWLTMQTTRVTKFSYH